MAAKILQNISAMNTINSKTKKYYHQWGRCKKCMPPTPTARNEQYLYDKYIYIYIYIMCTIELNICIHKKKKLEDKKIYQSLSFFLDKKHKVSREVVVWDFFKTGEKYVLLI